MTTPATRKHTSPPRPEIVVRRPTHHLDRDRARRWLRGDAATLVLHALSPTFPGGETFFIKSVMAFRDRIDDPALLVEMQRFSAQEAVHTREHLAYDAIVQHHYDVQSVEEACRQDLAGVFQLLGRTQTRWLNGPRIALAITVALEHLTATLGHQALADDSIFEGVEPEFAKLWRWHAVEELEHKAVAFDVFEAVGGTWLERSVALLVMGTLLSIDTTRLVTRFLRTDGQALRLRPWAEILRFLFVSPGVLRRALPQLVDFYRPGFHPWDHDDRALIGTWAATASA